MTLAKSVSLKLQNKLQYLHVSIRYFSTSLILTQKTPCYLDPTGFPIMPFLLKYKLHANLSWHVYATHVFYLCWTFPWFWVERSPQSHHHNSNRKHKVINITQTGEWVSLIGVIVDIFFCYNHWPIFLIDTKDEHY